MLYAIYPDRGYFDVSDPGKVTFTDEGKTKFELLASGKHRYLKLTESQKVRVIESLVQLSSQPPHSK